ncbi:MULTISPECIES: protein phosphatase 2C domain-containing protein [Streptomyces]|uniref:protein phosphatase 2C domain-containing protein n=1 Tax=Streptomyces TaxID=1883 RepID=UPI0031E5CF0B
MDAPPPGRPESPAESASLTESPSPAEPAPYTGAPPPGRPASPAESASLTESPSPAEPESFIDAPSPGRPAAPATEPPSLTEPASLTEASPPGWPATEPAVPVQPASLAESPSPGDSLPPARSPEATADPASPAPVASTGSAEPPAPREPASRADAVIAGPCAPAPASVDYVGSGPPTYDPEPTALPLADPDGLGELVADTALDGARYGACTLRAVSLRGDSARYRGEPRRDSLLTARFGTGEQALVLVAMATGVRGTPGAHLAAAEACRWIARAVGRSHQRLVADIRTARRGDLKSGLQRLTDRSLGKLRASAAEQGVAAEEYAASLRCLLLPADPDCRTRVFFGVGDGGLFRLRDGAWQDIEPRPSADGSAGPDAVGFASPPERTPEGDRLTMDLGIPAPPSPFEPAPEPPPEPPREPFRFRASVARPGDALVMCTAGLADPLRGEPALCAYLARRWSGRTPPGLAAFLADAQVRVKGYADDRTAAAVWEA